MKGLLEITTVGPWLCVVTCTVAAGRHAALCAKLSWHYSFIKSWLILGMMGLPLQ